MRNGLGSFKTIMTGRIQWKRKKKSTIIMSMRERIWWNTISFIFEFHNPVAIPSIFNFWKKAYVYQLAPSNGTEWNIQYISCEKRQNLLERGIAKYKWILEIEFEFHLREHFFNVNVKTENRTLLISNICRFPDSCMHMNLICHSEKLFLEKKLWICLHFSIWLNGVKVTEIQIFCYFEKKTLLIPSRNIYLFSVRILMW